MSQPLRRRPVIKKRAKPLAEVHKGLMHQSIKLMTKTVKLVKGFLIQKCTRKIAELKESNGDVEKELEHLSELKSVDQAAYGTVVANRLLSIGNKDVDDNGVNQSILSTIMKQKKLIEVIQDIEKHIKESVERNNERRATEQRNEAKQAKKAKHLLEKRTLSLKDRTEAMFLDTLEAPEVKPVDALTKKQQKEKERVKIEKNLRNKQNRQKNRAAKGGDAKGGNGNNGKTFKKRKFSSGDDTSSNNSSSNSALSKYMPVDSRGGHDNNGVSDRPFKSQKTHSHASAAAPVVPSPSAVKLEQVASGKDWKESGLHPSWAAKQLSKKAAPLVIGSAAAGVGQGKKITFD